MFLNFRSFGVRAPTIRERNAWLDALNTAIEDHNSRKATFFHNDQRIECKMGVAPPIWVPDRRVTMCQNCTVEFTVLIRRHHCRACGQVVCSTCSANKAPLRYLEFDSARVCDSCYDSLEKGTYLNTYLFSTRPYKIMHNELKRKKKINFKCVFGWLHDYLKD